MRFLLPMEVAILDVVPPLHRLEDLALHGVDPRAQLPGLLGKLRSLFLRVPHDALAPDHALGEQRAPILHVCRGHPKLLRRIRSFRHIATTALRP